MRPSKRVCTHYLPNSFKLLIGSMRRRKANRLRKNLRAPTHLIRARWASLDSYLPPRYVAAAVYAGSTHEDKHRQNSSHHQRDTASSLSSMMEARLLYAAPGRETLRSITLRRRQSAPLEISTWPHLSSISLSAAKICWNFKGPGLPVHSDCSQIRKLKLFSES